VPQRWRWVCFSWCGYIARSSRERTLRFWGFGLQMNDIFRLFSETASSASEPLAIFLWGIALVVLSSIRFKKPESSQMMGEPDGRADAPLVAETT
jgi:hypothetical protein